MTTNISFRQKIRHWRIDAASPSSSINMWARLFLGAVFGLLFGFTFGYFFPRDPFIVEGEKIEKMEEKRVEFENRLKIYQQAQERLNDINSDLREKYHFLLGQLMLSEEVNKDNNKSPNIKHLSIIEVEEGVYQYRILLVNEAHSPTTKYYLDFEFTSGESERVNLDVGNFSLPQDFEGKKHKKVVIPFLGKIEARKRQLKKTIFIIEENKKEMNRIETIYERK